jgi:hypothetical protein
MRGYDQLVSIPSCQLLPFEFLIQRMQHQTHFPLRFTKANIPSDSSDLQNMTNNFVHVTFHKTAITKA